MKTPTNIEICQWICKRCGAVLDTQIASEPDFGKQPAIKCSCSTVPDDRLPPFPFHYFDDANEPLKPPTGMDQELVRRLGIKGWSGPWHDEDIMDLLKGRPSFDHTLQKKHD